MPMVSIHMQAPDIPENTEKDITGFRNSAKVIRRCLSLH